MACLESAVFSIDLDDDQIIGDTIYQKGGANNDELFETSVRFKAKSDRALLTRVAENALGAFAEHSVNRPSAGGNTKNPLLVDFELKYSVKHLKYSNLYRIIKFGPSDLFKAYTEHPFTIDSKVQKISSSSATSPETINSSMISANNSLLNTPSPGGP